MNHKIEIKTLTAESIIVPILTYKDTLDKLTNHFDLYCKQYNFNPEKQKIEEAPLLIQSIDMQITEILKELEQKLNKKGALENESICRHRLACGPWQAQRILLSP